MNKRAKLIIDGIEYDVIIDNITSQRYLTVRNGHMTADERYVVDSVQGVDIYSFEGHFNA